ncbi:response regulator transcription factor [Burkholderia sp. SIMBA_043]|uniref:response regulator transcription factor n=2 Tax=Pseudomonadati TaxID=3379134 RepID=UPI0005D98CC4|nr:response regulator transcription factor [Burkholderia vietnamiensis]AJY06266.1 bacterial regulatory s, luxR family protein [Burkholderia vietnamiensis LMG 10929]KVM54586.1 LuxR family transcriptional regulator [Burkholderia vietnamiensis]KVS04300.1 LuxR family transcriptional regulator [Burkholderia vietnamiensis]UBI27165.1 response regulator transcription factor [Burkholderia vietnamiensis]
MRARNEFSIKVVIADDHPTILSGLVYTLEHVSTIEIVATCRNAPELIATLEKQPCDVVVSDYSMPSGESVDGLALFEHLRRHFQNVGIVALTMMDSPAVIRALMSVGINSILSKSDVTGHIITAIHSSYAGGSYLSPTIEKVVTGNEAVNIGQLLSPRELEVARLFASGLSITEIAKRLNRSKQTISTQKAMAMEKLGVGGDAELIRYALESGLVTSPPAPKS